MRKSALVVGVALSIAAATGCGSNADSAADQNASTDTYISGNETVGVEPYESLGVAYPTLDAFLASAESIVEARVTGTQTIATEVQPPPGSEGAIPGLGPDIYGTIDFEVLSVLKGDPSMKSLRVAFKSGKRDGDDKSKRIAYTHGGYVEVQSPNGELRPASDVSEKRFLVLTVPNGQGETLPVPGKVSLLAHPNGLATILGGGQLKFGNRDSAPVSNAEGKLTISDVRTSLSK